MGDATETGATLLLSSDAEQPRAPEPAKPSSRRGKQYKCGFCQGLGHNSKTCPKRLAVTRESPTRTGPATNQASGRSQPTSRNSRGPVPLTPRPNGRVTKASSLANTPTSVATAAAAAAVSDVHLGISRAHSVTPGSTDVADHPTSRDGTSPDPSPIIDTRTNGLSRGLSNHFPGVSTGLQLKQQPQSTSDEPTPDVDCGINHGNELTMSNVAPTLSPSLQAATTPQTSNLNSRYLTHHVQPVPLEAAINAARNRVLEAENAVANAESHDQYKAAVDRLGILVDALERVVGFSRRCDSALRSCNDV